MTVTAEQADQGAALALFSNGDLDRGERAYEESALLEVSGRLNAGPVCNWHDARRCNHLSTSAFDCLHDVSVQQPTGRPLIHHPPPFRLQRLREAVGSAHPDAPPEAVAHVAHEGKSHSCVNAVS